MPIYTDKRNGRMYVQFDYRSQTYKQYLPLGIKKSDAEKIEIKMRSDAMFAANGLAPRNDTIFDDAVQEYLAHIKHHSDKYYRAEYVLIAAKPFLKGKSLRSIKATDIERFMFYRMSLPTMHDKTRAPATVWREIAVISAFFTFCVKSEYIEFNPCSRVDKPSFDNIQDRVLEIEDEADFLAAFCDDTARDICIVVLNMGLSQNDVLGLNDFQISRKRREITITRGKTKKHESLPINDEAWAVIEPRLGQGLLFKSSKTGGQLKSIKKAIAGACRRVNAARKEAYKPEMKIVTIRDLRRTFGTRLESEDDVTKARLLCHGDTRMLIRYARSSKRMRDAVQNLSKPTQNLRIVKGRSD